MEKKTIGLSFFGVFGLFLLYVSIVPRCLKVIATKHFPAMRTSRTSLWKVAFTAATWSSRCSSKLLFSCWVRQLKVDFFLCCRFYNFPSSQSLLRQLYRNWLGLRFSTVVTHISHMTVLSCFLLGVPSHVRTLWCNLLHEGTSKGDIIWHLAPESPTGFSFFLSPHRRWWCAASEIVFATWHALFSHLHTFLPLNSALISMASVFELLLQWKKSDSREERGSQTARRGGSWLACSSPVVTHGRTSFKCLLINIHVSSSIQCLPTLHRPCTPPKLLPNLLLPRVSKAVSEST